MVKVEITMKNVILLYFVISNLSLPAFSGSIPNEDIDMMMKKYQHSIDSMKDISMKILTDSWVMDPDSPESKIDRSMNSFLFRRDNENTEWFGNCMWYTDKNEKEFAHEIGEIYVKKSYMNSYTFNQERRARILLPYPERQELLLSQPTYGSSLWGRVYGNGNHNLSELLRLESNIKATYVNIGDSEVVLITGESKFGNVKLWLSPEKDFNAVKWSIEKSENHLFDNASLKDGGLMKWEATFEATDFFHTDGKHIVKSGKMSLAITDSTSNKTTSVYTYKVSDLQLSPDFDALNAFTLKTFNLPSGSLVNSEITPGITYTWSGSELIANVDEFAIDIIEETVAVLHPDTPAKQSSEEKANSNVKSETQIKTQVLTDNSKGLGKESFDAVKLLLIILVLLICVGSIALVIKGRKNV